MPGMTFQQGVALWQLLNSILSTLIWPLTIFAVVLLFKNKLANLVENLNSAELPWIGGKFNFSKAAAQVNAEANRPDPDLKLNRPLPTEKDNDLNTLLISRELRPSNSGSKLNYFRELVSSDPNLALAGLRIEFETLVSNLVKANNLPASDSSLGRMLTMLVKAEKITPTQFDTSRRVLELCNRAVHGQVIDPSSALAVIDAAEPLINNFKNWLFWNLSEEGGHR